MSDPCLLRGGPLHPQALGTLDAVCRVVGGRLLCGAPGLRLQGVAADTRAVRPGDLFVALRGARVDAHALLGQAFAAGAGAVLVDREPGDAWGLSEVPAGCGAVVVPAVVPSLARLARVHLDALEPGPTVVGVTGSLGKTTTRGLIAAALSAGGAVLVPDESFNTEISLPLTCLRADGGHRYAALELAMRGPGQIAQLARICRPRVGVLTVIGESHLELLGSIEAIAAAKGELLEALPGDGWAVLNADDPRQAAMAARSAAPVRTYGLQERADVSAGDLRPLPAGRGWSCTARLAGSGQSLPLQLPLLGRHQVASAMAALCCAELLGVEPHAAALALQRVSAPGGRLTLRPCGDLLLLDDTFNAAPLSALAALQTLTGLAAGGTRAAVLGDMLELGSAAEEGHWRVGRGAAAAALEWLITVGPLAQGIAHGAIAGGMAPGRVHAAPDAAAAEPLLLGLLGETARGAVVLFKGSHAVGLDQLVAAAEGWAEPASPASPGR